jgi:dolichyl-phosphate-mannose--protein O-mannosyl transferase
MQIITSVKETDDYGSLFIIKEAFGQQPCETGEPMKCGDIVRFEHANTGKNLHSHNFPSWITDSQEACGFGHNGEGDLNDNWQIQCYNYNEPFLRGKAQFFLQHQGTKQYLYINIKRSLFNEHNCRGCPVMNHREVSCTNSKDKQTIWKIIGGIIYNTNNEEELDHVDVKRVTSTDL